MAEWIAYATMENVGNPVPEDKEEAAKKQRQAKRAEIEGGLRRLQQKQNQG